MTMTAIRINNVIINATSRAQARDMAKESGGKIVDRGTFAAKRWGVKVDRIHCADFGDVKTGIRRGNKFMKNSHLVECNGKKIVAMTSTAARQLSAINMTRAKVA